MASLFDISNELMHEVLVQVTPGDLGRLSQCCRSLNTFIKDNELLWKELYLQHFDDPREQAPKAKIAWQEELSRMWKLHLLLSSKDTETKRTNFPFIASAIDDLVTTSIPGQHSLNCSLLRHHFDESPGENRDTILCGSSLFREAGSKEQSPFPAESERQMSAKLHVLHGVPAEPSKRRANPIHTYARSRVYDLRRYTDHTFWGPFRNDGSARVDWENLESIMIVISHNIQRFCERTYDRFRPIWETPFSGISRNSFQSKPPFRPGDEGSDEGIWEPIIAPSASSTTPKIQRADSLVTDASLTLEEQDPYGVTGTWARIVCFLDYTDLYAFNFENDPIPADQPREPISTQEAIRFITINLRVKKIEPPGPDDGQELPVVHFTGTSRSMHASWDPNANSAIRGTVRLTPEGHVRWTSFSIFHGEERWRSECIQVGGHRSGRGMLGTWFDKDYSPEGPAGPTAFWKISDSLVKTDHHPPLLPFS